MYSIGYLTVVLYLISLTIFTLAAYNPNFFYVGSAISGLFFLIPTAILGWMVAKRKATEFKN